MTTSSRTPEGESARCPLCSAPIVVEPSIFVGDATCPQCGQLVWFLQTSVDSQTFFAHADNEKLRDQILSKISERFNVPPEVILNNPSFLNDVAADSLDVVELVMELEEQYDILEDE